MKTRTAEVARDEATKGDRVETADDDIDLCAKRPREGMTVFVADDEAGVRKLASRILRTSGYSVLEAGSGAEALVVARAWHGWIHLLVTDVVMPGMNGWELARRLQDERPGLKTLYISGYSEDAAGLPGYSEDAAGLPGYSENAAGLQGLVDREIHFLQKPFTAGALVQKVRQLLDAATIR